MGTFAGDAVDGGRIEVLVPMEGEVSPALVVGEDDDDVRVLVAGGGGPKGEG